MGFTIYYRSAEPLNPNTADAIREATHSANTGRTWLNCEPVHFFFDDGEGHLLGGSKPNFMPHPDDVASAAKQELPDGTTRDMLEILCQLSREHGVAWEITHDHSDGVVGYIREGICDDEVLAQIDAFSELADMMGELELGEDGEWSN